MTDRWSWMTSGDLTDTMMCDMGAVRNDSTHSLMDLAESDCHQSENELKFEPLDVDKIKCEDEDDCKFNDEEVASEDKSVIGTSKNILAFDKKILVDPIVLLTEITDETINGYLHPGSSSCKVERRSSQRIQSMGPSRCRHQKFEVSFKVKVLPQWKVKQKAARGRRLMQLKAKAKLMAMNLPLNSKTKGGRTLPKVQSSPECEAPTTVAMEATPTTVAMEADNSVSEVATELKSVINKDPGDGQHACQCPYCGQTFRRMCQVCAHCLRCHSREIFVCAECGNFFDSESLLRTHGVQFHNAGRKPARDRNLRCTECGNFFVTTAGVRKHRCRSKPYVCQVCQKAFRAASKLSRHMLVHSDERPFACDICARRYRSSKSLKRHAMKHSLQADPEKFLCDKSPEVFKQRKTLVSHISVQPYVCQDCQQAFHTAERLSHHMLVHSEERPFACDICARRYRSSKSLKRHAMIMKHPRLLQADPEKFFCEKCPKVFKQQKRLVSHMRWHSGELPDPEEFIHKCVECDQSFRSTSGLKYHVFAAHTRTVQPPSLKCDICGRQFRKSESLHEHLCWHSGEPAYQCDTCGKCFQTKHGFDEHILEHGVKPFLCALCGQGYTRIKHLEKHMCQCTGNIPKTPRTPTSNIPKTPRRPTGDIHTIPRTPTGDIPSLTPRTPAVERPKRAPKSNVEDESFICGVCGKIFRKKILLKIHDMVHSSVKLFKCKLCNAEFKHKRNVRRHILKGQCRLDSPSQE